MTRVPVRLGEVAAARSSATGGPCRARSAAARRARPGWLQPRQRCATLKAQLGLGTERRGQRHDRVAVLGLRRPGRRRRAPRSRSGVAGARSSQDTCRGPVGTPIRGTSSLTGRSATTAHRLAVRRPHLDAAVRSSRRARGRRTAAAAGRPAGTDRREIRRRTGTARSGPSLVDRAGVRVRPAAARWSPAPRTCPRRRCSSAGPGRSPSATSCRPSRSILGSIGAPRPGSSRRSSGRRAEHVAATCRPLTSATVPPRLGGSPPSTSLTRRPGTWTGSASALTSPVHTPMPSGSSIVKANRCPSGAQTGTLTCALLLAARAAARPHR